MKSHANLWPHITSFENLFEAFRRARIGKRSRPDVAAFEFDLESNLPRPSATVSFTTRSAG